MLGLRATASVTALCLGCWLGPASAGAAPTVMVWPGEAGAPVAAAEDALRAEGVRTVPQARVGVVLAEHRAARDERERARRERVEAGLAAAQEHYLELELSDMIAELDAVEADALALARPGRCEGLWELEFRQGLGRLARGAEGDRAATDARFELALALELERRPLGELYGPDVTAAFLRAVEHRSARVARPVPLRVQPADAAVEIDCRKLEGREVAGREVSLLPGLHAVRVSAPGFVPWSGLVELRAQSSIDVELAMQPAEHDAARRLASSTDTDAVDEASPSAHAVVLALARESGARAVLVVGHHATGFRVRVWGHDAIGAAVERPELAQALHAATRLLDDDGRLRVPALVEAAGGPAGRPPPPARKPVLRTWWFWTIVGSVVVAGGALGLGLGLGLREPEPGRLVIVAR